MKRTAMAVLAATLILGLMVGPADAKKKKKKPPAPVKVTREVVFDYLCPCTGVLQFGTLGAAGNLGGGPVDIGAGEIYLTATGTDTSGMDVGVMIQQDDGTGANGGAIEGGAWCGATEAPVLLTEGMQVRVWVGDLITCPGLALGGTITFTLSNMP